VDLKFVASVAERDIDFLILEELSVSIEFQEWFSSRVFNEAIYKSKIGAWHSVSVTGLGESDLVFIFSGKDGQRNAILIENKVDAPPQKKQGYRYKLRGEKGVKEGYWEKLKTCIIAPQKYLSSSKNTEEYDSEISYEEIFSFFQSRCSVDRRFSYKAQILLEAIEQNRRGYQPEYNQEITEFVSSYYQFAAENYSDLNMQKVKPRPAGSTWVMFYPKSLPEKTDLMHQLTKGLVKFFFNGQAKNFAELKEKYSPSLPDGATIALAGKSVAISIKVPKVEPISMTFEEQQEKIKKSLESLVKLARYMASNNRI